jgi:hypothetical protein
VIGGIIAPGVTNLTTEIETGPGKGGRRIHRRLEGPAPRIVVPTALVAVAIIGISFCQDQEHKKLCDDELRASRATRAVPLRMPLSLASRQNHRRWLSTVAPIKPLEMPQAEEKTPSVFDRRPSSRPVFYLPCHPDDPDGKFLRVFKGNERQAPRPCRVDRKDPGFRARIPRRIAVRIRKSNPRRWRAKRHSRLAYMRSRRRKFRILAVSQPTRSRRMHGRETQGNFARRDACQVARRTAGRYSPHPAAIEGRGEIWMSCQSTVFYHRARNLLAVIGLIQTAWILLSKKM